MAITLGTITKITDNTLNDSLPAVIDGNRVTFAQVSGAERRIAIWNNGGIVFVDSNANNFLSSTIDANVTGEIIWTRQFVVGDNDVYRYNGSNVIRVDFSGADSSNPSIAKPGTYVYQLGANNITINDTLLGERTIPGTVPDSDGNKVVYLNAGGQVAVYDIVANTTQVVTSSASVKSDPHIYGNRLVWTELNGAGGTSEIMTASLTGGIPQIQQITNNNNADQNPDIYNNLIVWQRFNGSDFDILAYDASDGSMQEVTLGRLGNATDPSVGKDGIAWVENDGDNEIFFARTTTGTGFDPLTGLTLDQGRELAGLYTVWFGRVPDRGGWQFWKDNFTQGRATMPQIAELFSMSAEAHAIYDFLPGDVGLDPNAAKADMVNKFYNNLFNRAPDLGGFNFWLGHLNNNNEFFSDDLSLMMIQSAAPSDLARIDANIQLI